MSEGGRGGGVTGGHGSNIKKQLEQASENYDDTHVNQKPTCFETNACSRSTITHA